MEAPEYLDLDEIDFSDDSVVRMETQNHARFCTDPFMIHNIRTYHLFSSIL